VGNVQRILVAGVTPDIVQEVNSRTEEFECAAVETGAEALRALATQTFQAALFLAQLPDLPGEEVARRARELLRQDLPCRILPAADAAALEAGLAELLRLPPAQPTGEARALQRRWGTLKEQFRRTAAARLSELEEFRIGGNGSISTEELDHITQVVREVAAAADLLDRPVLVRQSDQLLQLLAEGRTDLQEALETLLEAITAELGVAASDSTAGTAALMPSRASRRVVPVIWLMTEDEVLLVAMKRAAGQYGGVVEAAPPEAEALAHNGGPDALIVDLAASNVRAERLRPWSGRPIIAITPELDWDHRYRAMGLGVHRFMPRFTHPERIVDVALSMLDVAAVQTDSMVVVGNEELLRQLHQMSELVGYDLVPSRVDAIWSTLNAVRPALLLLDGETDGLDAQELCRALRIDPHYRLMPIIYLAREEKLAALASADEAPDADDFLAKPASGLQLASRAALRLRRSQNVRETQETDPATGGYSRAKFSELFFRYQNLSERSSVPLSLAMIEVSALTPGDRSATATGVKVRELVRILRRKIRREDFVGYWGGHRILVGLMGIGKLGAAERLVQMIQPVFAEQQGDPMRFSGGVAEWLKDGQTLTDLFVAAEGALQQARSATGSEVWACGVVMSDIETVDVVLIDGDEIMGNLLNDTLVARGLRTRWITDGLTARSLLVSDPPALRGRVIVLDVNLPGVDGLTLTRLLRESGSLRGTRVVMLTARTSESEIVQGLQAGAWDYIGKPVNPKVLLERVRRALDGR
jgi:DNA-binding response OmpR family regulator